MFCSIIPWFILGLGFGKCNRRRDCRCRRDRFDDHHDCRNRRGY